jgi:pimeloyl-ACP methyl ester carboxylesterase
MSAHSATRDTAAAQQVRVAGLDAPVLAGHSMSGGIASVYAAHHPTRGVVNVDAPPDLAPFVRLLQSAEEQIRGDGFAGVWAMLEQSFRTDLLPPQVREFISRNSHPRQDVAVSYWDELLAQTPEQMAAIVGREFTAVAATAVPYLLVLGAEPAPGLAERIRNTVPRATVEIWDGTGHFPHLAYPARFAERLAATAQWPEAPARAGRTEGWGDERFASWPVS